MTFQKEYLDLILVPLGLLIMFSYHLILLYRYLNRPHTTAMGFENNDKKIWVDKIMAIDPDKRDLKNILSVLQNNTSAATFLATVSLTLCSLIGAWIANSSNFIFQSSLIYGDTRPVTISINVEIAVIRGSDFWSVGLRALYFALNFLLWFFGPIPMLACSVSMVMILHYLDSNSREFHTGKPQPQSQIAKGGYNL
ncbi:hypothetical protein PIB30_027966 [Stylosanthes scabra]|uniref:Uncharacterized protein n=1 Tax=Stylosanthes scabra TaxID=79078 RepID=A0ABU6TAI0_9FABA|nr:hypothetical protein [Stylosanthes scabra]